MLVILLGMLVAGCDMPGLNVIAPKLTQFYGHTFVDLDQDGSYDPNDLPLAGVTVELYALDGTIVASMVSNENGAYTFDGVEGGNYYLVFQSPAGYQPASFKSEILSADATSDNTQVSFSKGFVLDVVNPPLPSPEAIIPVPSVVEPQQTFIEAKPGDRVIVGDVAFSSFPKAFVKYDSSGKLYYVFFTLENMGKVPLTLDLTQFILKDKNGACQSDPTKSNLGAG